MEVMQRIWKCGVLPVAVFNSSEEAVETASAMLKGGVDAVEITFRTPAAGDAIEAVSRECPEMLVGAGTVLTVKQCEDAVKKGAKFIVSPGFSRDVVGWCLENGVPVVPGCVTPTEITTALCEFGLKTVKFFPAALYGGLKGLKSLAAPFGQMNFIPTGGIGQDDLAEYLSAPFIYAVGGSWLCSRKAIEAGDYEAIASACEAAREVVKEIRR
jgi:2-dehydro-3-deoxyphosphogluconate aldolase/(4S)-4-hydroxy-2-oxoglutarate aldolase